MKRWTNKLILLCTLLFWLPAVGQNADRALGVSSTETQGAENTRRLIYKVAPVYPPELRDFYRGGRVGLVVKFSPKGGVRPVCRFGGNLFVVEGGVKEVKKGKSPPASSDTGTQVTIVFDLRH